ITVKELDIKESISEPVIELVRTEKALKAPKKRLLLAPIE
ncbi:11120_t:CDS:1, partial [Funneliformis caledonium]